MALYTARRVIWPRRARKQCRMPRADGSRCTLDALLGKRTCVVHTKSGTRHARGCRCARCAQQRNRERGR